MRKYAWRRDALDPRDMKFSAVHHPHIEALPDRVSLAGRMPAVLDQGQEGSCVENAVLAAFGFIHPGFMGSRQFVYYGAREIEGTIASDAGSEIRDAVKVLAGQGAPPEDLWPYDAAHFSRQPTPEVYAAAAAHKVVTYSRLETEDDMRSCLAVGFPFVIGAVLFEAFESAEVARTGLVPLPDYDTPILGGHAFAVIGYDEHSPIGRAFECQNSWSADWGLRGRFWIPMAYLTHPDLAADAWTLRA